MNTRLRRLGPAEELMVWADPVAPINNCAVVTLDGAIDPARIAAALAVLQQEHPLAGARIAGERLHRVFVTGAPPIPLSCIDADEGTVRTHVETEMDTPFATGDGPLLRATLLRHGPARHTLLLVFHHAVCDGRAGLAFVDAVLRYSFATLPAARCRPLPPDASQCLPAEARGWAGFRRMQQASKALMAEIRQANTAWPLEESVALDQRHKTLLWHTFPADVSARFLARIAAEGSSEQSAMSAIAAAALGKVLGLSGELLLATALDLSRRLKLPEPDAFFIATSALTTRVAIANDDNTWPAAKALKAALRRCFTAQQHLYLTPPSLALNAGIARWLGLGRRGPLRLARLARAMSACTLSHTSMGTLALPAALPGITVEGVVFLAGYTTNAPLVSLAQTFDGRLCWSLGGFREQFGEQRLQAVLQDIVRQVETLAGEAP